MDAQALRTKIRALMVAGTLPTDPYARAMRIEVGHQALPDEQCAVCRKAGPHVSYMFRDGKVIRLHATCDALWREERPAS